MRALIGKIAVCQLLKNRKVCLWLAREIINSVGKKDVLTLGLYVRRRIIDDKS